MSPHPLKEAGAFLHFPVGGTCPESNSRTCDGGFMLYYPAVEMGYKSASRAGSGL